MPERIFPAVDPHTGAQLLDDRGHARFLAHDSRIVHQLSHADHPRPRQHRHDIVRVEGCAGRLQPRYSRDTRWDGDKDTQRQPLAGPQHILNPGAPADIGDLVRVDHDRGGAKRQYPARKVRRRDHGRLNMDVGVDETWDGDQATRIDLGGAGQAKATVLINYRDSVAENTDIGKIHLASVDVEQIATANHEIERAV